MPFALVTESGGRGLRQHLGHRQRRTGKTRTSALIDEATRRSQVLGVPHLHLVSRPALREFYTGLGWRELEYDVGKHRQVLYARELGAVPSQP